MNKQSNYDVIIIGGGPAGLAAAIAAKNKGAEVLVIERETRLGGILKQCIHDGFGLIRFGEKLSGPEYAEKYIDAFKAKRIDYMLLSFVTGIEERRGRTKGFVLSVVNSDGVHTLKTKTLVMATGCRERTAKQVSIHGTRPAGVFTAGTAQNLVNIYGEMPTRRCVILGSGDIGLIMARRLTLEGAEVVGVYEAKAEPSGLLRNVAQCLEDYSIPLHLSHTVTRVFGTERLEGVEVAKVDGAMNPIAGTEEYVQCDALILSVGLIPENELAEMLGVAMDAATKGPLCDDSCMTSVEGLFACGNCLHVNDLVDYVSESGELAGAAAADYCLGENAARYDESVYKAETEWDMESDSVEIFTAGPVLYTVPQMINVRERQDKAVLYFRASQNLRNVTAELLVDGKEVLRKKYVALRPPEMERVEIDLSRVEMSDESEIVFALYESSKESRFHEAGSREPSGKAMKAVSARFMGGKEGR